MDNKDDALFQALDMILFFGFLVISLGIGLLNAYRDRSKKGTEHYFLAGKTMPPILVAVSASVSFISAVDVLGGPVEVYYYGLIFTWDIVAVVTSILVICKYYIPMYRKLEIECVNEYLEMRYSREVRLTVSVISTASLMILLSVITFVPALALTTVTPISLSWNIILLIVTATFYTTLGGYKAVVWTDAMQSLIMIGGTIVILGRTVYEVGGFFSVAEAAQRGGRMNFFTEYRPDPRIRSSIWSMFLGMSIYDFYSIGCSQIFVQRWLSCKATRDAQKAGMFSIIPLVIMLGINAANGLAVFAYYENCDPLTAQQISKPDQLLPHMALDLFRNTPGITGLFVSAVVCGALSSLSSAYNAISMQITEDFIIPKFPHFSQDRTMIIAKCIAVSCGVVNIVTAHLISFSPDNAMRLTTFSSLFSGPIVAIFTMGLFMPWIDTKKSMGKPSSYGF